MQFVMKSNHFNDRIIILKVERVITGKAVQHPLGSDNLPPPPPPPPSHPLHTTPVQMLRVMSRNLINLPIMAVRRCAKEVKPCAANVCSPFHRGMSQHDWRPSGHSSNSPDAHADVCMCVCVFFGDPDILTFSTLIPCITFFFLFHVHGIELRGKNFHRLQLSY